MAVPFSPTQLAFRSGGFRYFRRAEQVLSRGPFLECQVVGDVLLARVRGDAAPFYNVTLGSDLVGHCECPHFQSGRTDFCKHLLAAAVHWLKQDTDSKPARESPAAPAAAREPRSLRISSFEAEDIYSGLLEGTPDYCSMRLLEDLLAESSDAEDNNGRVVLIPAILPFPPWKCMATVCSDELIDGEGEGSLLTLCWFVDRIDASPAELVRTALAFVDWQQHAAPDLGW